MNFVAIDVETANKNRRSICQIGIAKFSNGDLVEQWETLVNPNEEFGWFQKKKIHNISADHVIDAPTFAAVSDKLIEYLTSSVMLHHGPFDREAIVQAFAHHEIPLPKVEWLDTGRVVKRTWKDRSKKGWGLNDMAEFLGIEFKHHDALEDAKATAQVLIAAIEESGVPFKDWKTRAYTSITPRKPSKSKSKRTSWDANPEGHLFGKTVLFTRGLSMVRNIASEMAADAGCNVASNFTSKTNWVVVGDAGLSADLSERTRKHKDALKAIEAGKDVQILCEAEFLRKIEGNEEDPESQQ